MLLKLTLKFTIWGPSAHYMADDFFIPNPPLHTVDDCNVLQFDFESVHNWADVNNMLFNASKFDYLSFACKTISFLPMFMLT